MAINRSGSYGKGKNRQNCPSSKSYKARAADADARHFDDFSKSGGDQGSRMFDGGAPTRVGGAGPSNKGNEG